MRSVIALVGRPNVGKSTLFNYLTRSRAALVADLPGLTRDRQYGEGKIGQRSYWLIDTGGLTGKRDDIDELMAVQVRHAIDESDAVLFLVDAQEGITGVDEEIAATLRRLKKNIYLVVNKTDGFEIEAARSDFFALGLGEPVAIAASHGRGVAQMIENILQALPEDPESPQDETEQGISIAIVGRPNVGKSTLVNRLLGEERVLTFDAPGTTRDSIYIPFEKDGCQYILIDTAGIRKPGRVYEKIEKFSVIKALQAVAEAKVVIQVIDAQEGLTEQDMHLLGQVLEHGRALVLAINKWDGLESEQRNHVKQTLERRLDFINFAEFHFISALHGSGVGLLLHAVDKAYASSVRDLATPRLTALLEKAVYQHQPPLVRGRRIKLRYAHQGGKNPPLIVIHGNQTQRLSEAYKRYLANFFQKQLDLKGTPVRIELKSSQNPFEGRRNTLTPRQLYKKKRLMKKVKKK